MSILIKGMKMPKDKDVILRIDSKGEVYIYGGYPTEIHEAVELPDHGDLIDMDKLIDDMKMFFGEETLVTMQMRTKGLKSTIKTVPKEPMIESLCNLTAFVKLSPAVIPAERSEE